MIDVSWDNEEKTVLRWRFTAPWTWDDMTAAQTQVNQMIDEVPGIVDQLFQTSREQAIPPNAIANFRNIISNRHRRSGLVILIGSRTFLTSLLTIITTSIPGLALDMHFVKTEAEAMALIEKAQAKRAQEAG